MGVARKIAQDFLRSPERTLSIDDMNPVADTLSPFAGDRPPPRQSRATPRSPVRASAQSRWRSARCGWFAAPAAAPLRRRVFVVCHDGYIPPLSHHINMWRSVSARICTSASSPASCPPTPRRSRPASARSRARAGEVAGHGGDRKINLPDVKVEDAGISYKSMRRAPSEMPESALRGQAGGETGANSPRQQLMTITPTNPRC